ncbi:metalloenzyme, LuxS/M16 peptidase-like protein [Artemisia annua]|uniref:Metalloenzyme, LuxS/M16 peptidase-like protein n=1 Tax=Artemisia annua TaxID=35608 RepID=A0A2U1PR72_ARTAN|nr:metalloenzyme, LuxS/M16 peptidase-like protein [Artemisia annua]
MASPMRKFLVKNTSSKVIARHEARRYKSNSTNKMQIMIRSFESIEKNLHWDLPPDTSRVKLPSTRTLYTVLKSPHVHKKAREQFHMKINKEMLVMEPKQSELSKKLFWLKRQRIAGAQFEILFNYRTRLDKEKLQQILAKEVVKENKIEERHVMIALNSLVNEGFYSEAVDASINSVETSLPRNNIGSFPQGLALTLPSVPMPVLKARVDTEGSKGLSTQLIEKFILNNPHRPAAQVQPDSESAERYNLEKLKSSMTEADLAELARVTRDLQLNPPKVPKPIPNMTVQNIRKRPIEVPTEVGDINGVKVLKHDIITNDVLYADIAFDMASLKPEHLPLVPLFCRSLLEMGTKDLDFVQLNQLIGEKTGGISVFPVTSTKQGSKDPVSHIMVRCKAMSANTEDLFSLIKCVLKEAEFTNQKRFKRFVSQSKTKLENQLRDGGHILVASRLNAKLSHAGWIAEQMGGISYLEFLKDLEEKIDEQWNEISMSLEEIRGALLSKKGCLVNLTSDGKNLKQAETFVSKFTDLLPSTSPFTSYTNSVLPSESEAFTIPTQVNYIGKAANIYDTGYQLKGSSYVISKYISNTWLWDNIRASGGAFGGVCDFDTRSGVFSFLSYRDPNLLKTLDVYDGTSDFLRQLEVDDKTLNKAIIGTIGDLDSYQLPDAKGYSSLLRYVSGVSEEDRQARRDEILSTRSSDFKEFADVVDSVKDNGVAVVVASEEAVDAVNKERSNLFQVKKAI